MKSIKDVITKPSEALEAMVKGLIKQSKRKTFRIDFHTFGDSEYNTLGKKICFGCAATCTLQEIFKSNFPSNSIDNNYNRAKFLNIDIKELSEFERAIDCVRKATLYELFDFFNIAEYPDHLLYTNFYLTSSSWKRQLPEVRKFIKRLKKNNL